MFDWSLARIVLLGFVISLSSTAVGATLIVGLGGWLATRERIHLPFSDRLRRDHELQVFAALLSCFGLAFLTGMLQLSTALGAFIGGMLVATARETDWVQHNLEPFRTLFVALFFVSVGLMIDPVFIANHWREIGLLVVAVLITNTFVNAGILRSLDISWRRSLLAGAMLSQIGEFSFILAAAGRQADIITDYAYQTTIAVISISLALSAPWIALVRRRVDRRPQPMEN